MVSLYILAEVVGVSGNVFIEPCQLHLMLFIIPLIYGGQFKTKLQWLNAFYAHSERLTCNFGGIGPGGEDGWVMAHGGGARNIMCNTFKHASRQQQHSDPEIWKPLRVIEVLNGDVWAPCSMLPEVFVCCCLMAISLLTFVIAANTPGNTNLRLNSQSAARDAAVMTNHSTAWWHCPSVHHTYILSRFALVLIFSHTSSSSWAL